jgi:sugar O-acyltransferase (sialic acid O-acetyltransferase NeuD family)
MNRLQRAAASRTGSSIVNKRPLIILGTGTFAEEVADYVHDLPHWELAGFVEGIDRDKCGAPFLGRPVTWIDDTSTLDSACRAVCAVGSTRRDHFIAQASAGGLRFTTLVHASAQVFASATLAEGVIVGAGAVIAARATIGAHSIVNRGCLIGHHVRVGSYATLGPGCNIAAKVRIGDGTYMGMGALVIDGVEIGAGCMIVAGALVSRNVPDSVKAAGSPARALKRGIDRV